MRFGFFLGTLKLDFQNILSESYTTAIGLINFCINLVLFIYEQTEYSVYGPFRDQLCKSGFKVQTNSFQLTFYHKNHGHWFIFRGLATRVKEKRGVWKPISVDCCPPSIAWPVLRTISTKDSLISIMKHNWTIRKPQSFNIVVLHGLSFLLWNWL